MIAFVTFFFYQPTFTYNWIPCLNYDSFPSQMLECCACWRIFTLIHSKGPKFTVPMEFFFPIWWIWTPVHGLFLMYECLSQSKKKVQLVNSQYLIFRDHTLFSREVGSWYELWEEKMQLTTCRARLGPMWCQVYTCWIFASLSCELSPKMEWVREWIALVPFLPFPLYLTIDLAHGTLSSFRMSTMHPWYRDVKKTTGRAPQYEACW